MGRQYHAHLQHSSFTDDCGSSYREQCKAAILVHTTGIYSNFKYASQGYKDVEKFLN